MTSRLRDAQMVQLNGERGRQTQRTRTAAERLCGRTSRSAGSSETRDSRIVARASRRAGSLAPVPQASPLPGGIIGVLERQGRHRCRRIPGVRAVAGGNLAKDQGGGFAIGDQVVEGQQQSMIVGRQTQQGGAQQGTVCQVERPDRIQAAMRRASATRSSGRKDSKSWIVIATGPGGAVTARGRRFERGN